MGLAVGIVSKPCGSARVPGAIGPLPAVSVRDNGAGQVKGAERPALRARTNPTGNGRSAGLAAAAAAAFWCGMGSGIPLAGAAAAHVPAILGKQPGLVQNVAVFGDDERRIITGRRHAWVKARVGLLTQRKAKTVCTAFCVAEDIIATAGHCVAGTMERAAGDPEGLSFLVDAGDAEVAIRPQQFVTGTSQLRTRPPINATSDWAFLRLERAACPRDGLRLSRISSQEAIEASDAGRIYNVAYHRDLLPWRLAIGSSCPILSHKDMGEAAQLERDFENAGNLLLHTCDTEAASSGSPLLIDGDNGPEVVGINVGTYVRSRVIMHDGKVVQRLNSEVVANTALLAAPLDAQLAAFAAEDVLTRRGEIALLQAYLSESGINAGPSDGIYGARTRAAIEIFEARAGLPVTGLATRRLLDRLDTAAARTAKATDR